MTLTIGLLVLGKPPDHLADSKETDYTLSSVSERQPDGRMLGALLRHPLQALVAEVNQSLVADGFSDLRPAHSAVFVNLGSEGVRINELAERAGMTKQSMGALVSYLEKRGYVSVSPDPRDGRAKVVRRTKKGVDSHEPARRIIARVHEKWRRLLGPGEMDELERLLRKLNDRLIEEQATRLSEGERTRTLGHADSTGHRKTRNTKGSGP
jgi:DNA-binding MarR family transcriptional regulator